MKIPICHSLRSSLLTCFSFYSSFYVLNVFDVYKSIFRSEQTALTAHLQDHVNSLSQKSGVKNISVITDPLSKESAYCKTFPLKKTIIINPRQFSSKEEMRAAVNHEIGHIVHAHNLIMPSAFLTALIASFHLAKTQRAAIVKTVMLSVIFLILKNPVSRMHEQQADSFCKKVSTKEELQGIIAVLKRNVKDYPNPDKQDFIARSKDFFLETHPHPEDRIAFFQKASRKKI